MSASLATADDLEAFLPADHPTVDEPERLLARATEVVDGYVLSVFTVDDGGLPTDPIVSGNLRDAVCAQVEFWLEVGEDHDVAGLTGGASIGSLHLDRLPPVLAPRARRILTNGGLIGGVVVDGIAS